MTEKYRYQLRRDSSSVWASVNTTLAEGEPAYETDTFFLKIGDGETQYNDLPHVETATVGATTTFATTDSTITVVNGLIVSVEDNPPF